MVPASMETAPPVIQAVALNAERQALLTAAYLKRVDPLLKRDGFPSGANGLPAGFLLELGAALMLGYWEQEGLRAFLPTEVPMFADAARELKCRAETAPFEFLNCDAAHLARHVQQVWLERFAWDAPKLMQADFVLGDVDEDVLVDAVAQLIWDNRHKSSN